jgi:preprotein translocase subunit SecG
MDSKQISMIVTIIAALSSAMIATPVLAQNMTGGNMTGGNMTGKISGGGIMGDSSLSNALDRPTFGEKFKMNP